MKNKNAIFVSNLYNFCQAYSLRKPILVFTIFALSSIYDNFNSLKRNKMNFMFYRSSDLVSAVFDSRKWRTQTHFPNQELKIPNDDFLFIFFLFLYRKRAKFEFRLFKIFFLESFFLSLFNFCRTFFVIKHFEWRNKQKMI